VLFALFLTNFVMAHERAEGIEHFSTDSRAPMGQVYRDKQLSLATKLLLACCLVPAARVRGRVYELCGTWVEDVYVMFQ
jgi:hypothetical protein